MVEYILDYVLGWVEIGCVGVHRNKLHANNCVGMFFINSNLFQIFHLCFAAQSFSRFLSDRTERPSVAKSFQDADTVWQAGVWLLPTFLRAPAGHETAEEGLGGRREPAKMDHQTGTA